MNGFGNVSRYLWLISSIFVITGVFGYLYYSETVRKEEYFNQLSFRELGEVSRGLETNLSRLMNFARQTRADLNGLREKLKSLEGTPTVQASESSKDFEKAQGQLSKGEKPSWEKTQRKVRASGLEIYRRLAPRLGLKDRLDTSGFTCDRGSTKLAPVDDGQFKGRTAFCAVQVRMVELTDDLGRYLGGERGTNDADEMTVLLDRIKAAASESEIYLNAKRRLEAQLEQNAVTYERTTELLQNLGDSSPKLKQTAGAELKQNIPAALGQYGTGFITEELVSALAGKDCLDCDATQRNRFRLLFEEELKAQAKRNKEAFDEFLYSIMSASVAEELKSLYYEFSNFVEAAAKSDPDHAQQRLDEYLDNTISKLAAAHDLKPIFVAEKTCPLAYRKESCEKMLFLSHSKTSSFYPGNRLSVFSYLPKGGVFEATLENLLPQGLHDFSTLVIAAENGEVLQQVDSGSDVVSHKFLSISRFVSEASKLQRGDSLTEGSDGEGPEASLKRTAYVDQDIGGIQYRVYIYPHKIGEFDLYLDKDKGAEQLIYVIGVKPLSTINKEKLSIGSGASVILLSVAIALLLALVFLKIQLAHIDASFTRLEGGVAAVSVVVFLVIVVIGSFSLALSAQIERDLRNDAVSSLSLLKDRFETEIESHLVQIDALLRSDSEVVGVLDGSAAAGAASGEVVTRSATTRGNKPCLAGPSIDERYLTTNLPPNLGRERIYPIENLFVLNAEGRVTGTLVRGTEYMVRRIDPDLSGRKYFQNALANRVWEVEVKDPHDHQFWLCDARSPGETPADTRTAFFPIYLERIFNLGDGTLNTQLSMPVRHHFSGGQKFDGVESYGIAKGAPKVISAGFTMRTFQAPVMPSGQGFAVVDNATGLVLYHSNDRRALVENFFQETENELLLRAFIETSVPLDKSGDVKHSSFSGLYRGTRTEFFVDKLHPSIPWTLVVYQDSSQGQDIVPVVFSVAMLIAFSTMLVIILLLALSSLMKLQLVNWLWPRLGAGKLYRKASFIALLGIPVYYLVLMWPPETSRLMLAILAITAVIIWWLRRVFLQADLIYPDVSGNDVARGDSLRPYTLFVMSVLLLLTLAPAVQVTNKVAYQLLQRIIAYDAVQQQKLSGTAAGAIEKRIDRLCGPGAYKQARYADCASIMPASGLGLTEIQEIETAADLPRGSLAHELLQPTNLMEVQTCDSDRVYCGQPAVRVGPDNFFASDAPVAYDSGRVIDFPLRLLRESRWELPVMLDAVSFADRSRYSRSGLDRSMEYEHAQNFRYFTILLFHNPIILFLLLVAFMITVAAIRFLAIRLLGIAVPRSYRSSYLKLNRANWAAFASGEIHPNEFEKDYGSLRTQLMTGDIKLATLIRPAAARLKLLLQSMEAEAIDLDGDRAPLDCHSLAGVETKRAELERLLSHSGGARRVLVLESLEAVAFDSDKRSVILDLLEQVAHSGENISVLLICDVAPLYMLTHQDRYVPNSMEKEFADAQESMRWSRLLSQFDKYYGWSPMDLEFAEKGDGRGWTNTLLRECSAWPELYYLKDDLDALKVSSSGITQEQAIQYIGTHAGPVYRRRWSFCTKEEKLLLYQLAKGQMINPMNAEPLEHLMRRGYIRRDPKWSVVSESFSRFILSAEEENIYLKWMTASEQGLWKVLRVPLITVALMILGILMYSAQETMESMLALATSVLAFLPLLLRNLSMLGGTKTPPPSN